VNPQGKWICDGEPKNNNQQYFGTGPHPPHENYGPDCEICGLPREAMAMQSKTVMSPGTGSKVSPLSLLVLVAIALFVLLGGGVGWYLVTQNNDLSVVDDNGDDTPTPNPTPTEIEIEPLAILSETATPNNVELISQGERILLEATPEKEAGAAAFAQKNWDEAITEYQQAADANPNDPEGKIYLNNAKAKQAGKPLTMAVVVPITPSANEAKEILRGVALAQEEFNESPASADQLLEVVIVNDEQTGKTRSLAEDLINFPNVLGVLGHGVDGGTRQAVASYEKAGLAVLSPVSINVMADATGQSIMKTISLNQQEQELLASYLQQVGETLADYAVQESSPASVAVFYNSDSPYSEALKAQFIDALSVAKGEIVKEVDVMASPSFDAATEIADASQAGANVALLALSKNKLDTVIDLGKANANQSGESLLLMGGDELYNPTILKEGDEAIEGMVLAVPWSWQSNDPFAQQASEIWKGRISWRTTTAYDATQALATALSQKPSRAEVAQQLSQGIPISGTAKEFDIFNEIPLVKVAPGTGGPTGSKYQFETVE